MSTNVIAGLQRRAAHSAVASSLAAALFFTPAFAGGAERVTRAQTHRRVRSAVGGDLTNLAGDRLRRLAKENFFLLLGHGGVGVDLRGDIVCANGGRAARDRP